MPRGRPTVLTPALINQIAELFLLAFDDSQVALMVGISSKTIQRYRRGEMCPAIKIAELKREAAYRKKIWAAKGFWQGAAWFLERKYPHQFAKPEIQMSNVFNQTTNNLVITAEVASTISKRRKEVESKVEKLFKDRRKRPQIGLRDTNGNGEGHDSGQEPETPESPHSDKD
jgi:hypothetical protein